jgi:hypothetical protein
VGLVFAAREAGEELGRLPELLVEGLRDGDARALLDSAFTGPLDARVRDQIVSEARGNPLALLELPRGPRRVPTRTLRRSWSVRPAGHRPGAAWRRRPRSWSRRRC